MLKTSGRHAIITRLAALLALLAVLFAPQHSALAHPVDMYAQNQSVVLTRSGLQVVWKITPGPLLADAVWNAADQNKDGTISPQEAQAWCAPLLPQWSVMFDNQSIAAHTVQDIHWPAGIDVFRTGEDAIRITFSVPWDLAGAPGTHTLEIHNSFLEANSLNWFSLAVQDRLSFEEPAQANGQLQLKINIPQTNGASATPVASALTSWDSGQPTLPGFGDAIMGLANNISGGQAAQPQSSGLTSATTTLVDLVKTQELSPWFLVAAFFLSLALGSLHALTPGHGKGLVAAYLVGSQGRTRDAVFLGSVVTLTHTGSVIILGLVTLLASHYILPSLIVPWLEVLSGLLVIGFGINLFLQRRGELSNWLPAQRKKKAAQFPLQAGSGRRFSLQSAQVAGAHLPGLAAPEKPDEHAHASHSHGGHSHTHAVPAGKVTARSLLTLGISGGLVPCPDAIAILLVAVALNRIPLGMLLILAFSIGLAFVLILIGIAMVQGVRLFGNNDLFNRFSIYTPVISAIVVSGLGVGLTLNALSSFNLAAAASQTGPALLAQTTTQPTFDIKQARLVYLAPDGQRQNQVTVLPLSGGKPATYTSESSGVAGYTLSPDRKTILYTVIRFDGSSSLSEVGVDGSHPHLLLDCPQAECIGPVWYPDGSRLVYERLNNPQNSVISVFSLWWLNPATGETRPVFQDQAFPSVAAGFSPDGQWLSYISPSNNTIQLFNLKGKQGSAITLSRNSQPRVAHPWDPAGGGLLFWEASGTDQNAPLHVKRYDLASGHRLDLGVPPDRVEYETAWSPDGQWIAIIQDGSSPGQPGQRQEIWLVRADGSQGHALVNEEQVSYSNLAWSPDGLSLAYCRYSTSVIGDPEIWLADLAGGRQTRLQTGGILPALLP